MKSWLVYGIVSLGIPFLWIVWVYMRNRWKKARARNRNRERNIDRILEQIAQRQKEEEELWR